MELTEQNIENVRAFVRRYCAVQTDEEGDEERSGRFALEQGPSQRKAKKARAPVKWGVAERVEAEVLRRVRELAGNGEGHVFICAYEEGETSPLEVLRIAGAVDALAETEEPPTDGGAVGVLVHGLMRSNALLVAENREWRERAFRGLDNALEDRERLTALALHSAMLEHAGMDQRMQDALQALGPTIEAVTPKIVEMIGAYLRGGPAPASALPVEPGPRIVAMVSQMVALANDLGPLCTANPAEVTRERMDPVYQLFRALAGPLGLTVTGYPPAPTEEPAS